MRISLIPSDPGYNPGIAGQYNVFVNGNLLIDCHTADEEKGRAWVYAYDSDGDPILDPATMEPILTVCLQGEVIIVEGEL